MHITIVFYIILGVITISLTNSQFTSILSSDQIDDVIRQRHDKLKNIAEKQGRPKCQNDISITVEEYPYGRSGNNMLELVHGLWIADVLNGTFRIPHFMKHRIFQPFQHIILPDITCSTYHYARSHKQMHMRAVELLNVWMMFKYDKFKHNFPLFSKTLVQKAANLYIRVMTSLWSSPSNDIVAASKWLIQNKLHNSFNYTTVHMRYMEGECPDIYRRMSNITDFAPYELPMNHPSWKHLSNESHPLCSMDLDFVQQVQKLANRDQQLIYLAYDGYKNISDYKAYGAIDSNDLDKSLFKNFERIESRKFIDMFLAIHGDFFIMNPRSTYSWYVYVVRAALGLPSVPMIRNRDLFFYSDNDYDILMNGNRWVGHYDIVEELNRMNNMLRKVSIED